MNALLESQSKERQAAGEQVHAQTESADGIEKPHTKESPKITSLPSPPTSVMAAESDSGGRGNDSHPAVLAGGEQSLRGSSAYPNVEADASMKNSTALYSMRADGEIS